MYVYAYITQIYYTTQWIFDLKVQFMRHLDNITKNQVESDMSLNSINGTFF